MKDPFQEYQDIIKLPHWQPKRHPRMPMSARAAQFAPFAALVGHDEALAEAGRLTYSKIEMSDDQNTELNHKMALLMERQSEHPLVSISYFSADLRKSGGNYLQICGNVKKIDIELGNLILSEDTSIPIHDICDIQGEIFNMLSE